MMRAGIAAAFITAAALLTTEPVAAAQPTPSPPAGTRAVRAASGTLAAHGLSPAAVPAPLRSAGAPLRASVPPPFTPPNPLPQERNSKGIPFMVAGAALFVSGAVVGGNGGTILMLSGAGIGAYGLFVYFGGHS